MLFPDFIKKKTKNSIFKFFAHSSLLTTHKITFLIRIHHVLLALFHKHVAIHTQGLSLLSPNAIRFATNFFMVAMILDMKEALKQIIIDVEWDTYVRTLFDMQRKPVETKAREVRRLILSDDSEFWQSFANYCTIMKATVAMLKEFYGKQPCMGNVYIIMRALCHHMVALRNTPYNMPGHLVESLEVVLKKKEPWLQVTSTMLLLFSMHTSLKIWNFVMTNTP